MTDRPSSSEGSSNMGQPANGFFLNPADNTGANAIETAMQVASRNGGATPNGSGHYSIDREHIPEMIKHLQGAKEKAEEAAKLASENEWIQAPGTDPYSPKAAQSMGPQLVNNYMRANQAHQDRLQAMIDSLNGAARQYDSDDDAAAQNFQQRT